MIPEQNFKALTLGESFLLVIYFDLQPHLIKATLKNFNFSEIIVTEKNRSYNSNCRDMVETESVPLESQLRPLFETKVLSNFIEHNIYRMY